MRIAIVTNRYPRNTEDTASPFVRDFCRALADHGCSLRVVTPFYPPEQPEEDDWVERFRWADSNRVLGQLPLRTPSGMLKAVRALTAGRRAVLQMTRDFRPDFIFALWALPSGWWARTAARASSIPYGVWCLGSDIQLWGRKPVARWLVRQVVHDSALLYADGYALASETESLAGRACGFLPTLRMLSGTAVAGGHPLDGQRYFLYLGRLARDKGVADLLGAAKIIGGNPGFRILFVGAPDDSIDVAREIERLNLQEVCRYVGAVAADDIPRHVAHADAVLLPSHRDSIPLVLGEAMQFGKPVICSDIPDFKALLGRYPVGQTVPCGDAVAWADALKSFQPGRFNREACARLLGDFRPSAAVASLLSDLADVVSERGCRKPSASRREHAYA